MLAAAVGFVLCAAIGTKIVIAKRKEADVLLGAYRNLSGLYSTGPRDATKAGIDPFVMMLLEESPGHSHLRRLDEEYSRLAYDQPTNTVYYLYTRGYPNTEKTKSGLTRASLTAADGSRKQSSSTVSLPLGCIARETELSGDVVMLTFEVAKDIGTPFVIDGLTLARRIHDQRRIQHSVFSGRGIPNPKKPNPNGPAPSCPPRGDERGDSIWDLGVGDWDSPPTVPVPPAFVGCHE
jgi:hypothetical protein